MAEKVPYHTICSCNPANGGSGVCGCIIGNELVDPGAHGNFRTRTSTNPPDYWWQRNPLQIEVPRLLTFLEMRIKECQSAAEMSDNPAFYRGKIAAYQEILEELNINK